MTCVMCAWTPENKVYRFVFETRHWVGILAPNQCLLGRCIVHLKRHAGDLADLRQEELLDWLEMVRMVEKALRSAFGATMFNWSCYMNLAYRDSVPDPHIHWWAVPRYDHPVRIGDWTFEDPEFGGPYSHDRWLEVPPEIHQEIAARVRQSFLG